MRTRLAVMLLLVTLASTGVWAVNRNVPASYPTIQAAINAAAAGDYVRVSPGTYSENIDFLGKAITVQSLYPGDPDAIGTTFIQNTASSPVVTFENGETSTSVLRGFTITGGSGATFGGGIYCDGTASPTIRNCVITGNSAGYGGGICALGGSITVRDTTISENDATDYGGGGYFEGSAYMTNVKIDDNTAAAGGGIDITGGGGTFENCRFRGNIVTSGGGGVSISGMMNNPSFTHCTFAGNSALSGGAMLSGVNAWPTVTNCTCYDNSATTGGTMYVGAGGLTVRNTIISNTSSGGAIYVADDRDPTLEVSYSCFFSSTGGHFVNTPSQIGINGNFAQSPLMFRPDLGDYHLKSTAGRWRSGTQTWEYDTVDSPCIDAGDPSDDYSVEPDPNGGCINIGAYGNTAYASKSASKGRAKALVTTASAQSTADGAQIVVNLSSAASVGVTITNVAGVTVAALPERALQAGSNTLLWNGKSSRGTKLPAGKYLVTVKACASDGTVARSITGLSK